ncbi:hypothetical protein Y88_1893 [Novosphingobium nitrogenifigens DSM 19370]|uniref:Peptidase A2 domain-containing protein n=1 Tax=Novosphingobium nitrogenifigens DSM 19370 TaxID=983920 RepID=F1Z554_9SPHN|nr:retropepsin-like aspartic protease [Novosphingobium nitrogenifigens]EGD60019.1 hypothetical protein Y88_1893 [Novosphingobium nitrogenifigens DSM 19370]
MFLSASHNPFAAAVLLLASLGTFVWADRQDRFPDHTSTAMAVLDNGANRDAASPPETGLPRIIRRAPDGMFYVSGRINGHTIRFLVDTGASVTVLTPEDAAVAGLHNAPGSSARDITTVSDTISGQETSLAHLHVEGRDIQNLRATVVDTRIGVSLLGQDALARLGPITLSGGTMTLGQ